MELFLRQSFIFEFRNKGHAQHSNVYYLGINIYITNIKSETVL